MASFSNLGSADGLKALNDFLAHHSYIDGFVASTADLQVLAALTSAPCAKSYPHAARWYYHITSFTCAKRSRFPAGKVTVSGAAAAGAAKPAAAAPAKKEVADDEVDFFADDDDEDDAAAREMERKAQAALLAQAAKGKKKEVAKTSILLDVKPWDDTTDMAALEAGVRSFEKDGLVWGSSKLVPVGYGIKKLQIMCVVEDDKVAVDDLEEHITGLEDYVQSMDVAAMNKALELQYISQDHFEREKKKIEEQQKKDQTPASSSQPS